MSMLRQAGKILVACSALTAILGLSHALDNNGQDYSEIESENLYAPGTIIHEITRQLNSVAPGMLFYFVNADEKRPAFAKEYMPRINEALDEYLTEKSLDPPTTSAMAYVSMKTSYKKNICAIYLRPEQIKYFAETYDVSLTSAQIASITHESIHCAHSRVSMKASSWRAYKKLANDYLRVAGEGVVTSSTKMANIINTVHAEVFVGAYYLTQLQASEKSDLMDHIAGFGWKKEYGLSKKRGYGNSFEALAALCANLGDCSTDIATLHASMLADQNYREALLKDATAIMQKGQHQ